MPINLRAWWIKRINWTLEEKRKAEEKANKQMWRLRRLDDLGARKEQMIVIIQRYIIPHLELSAPFWHYMITKEETAWLETVI